jgi:hypothetical protein
VDLSTLCTMPFSVQAYTGHHRLSVTTETAKEAFAQAVEWHVVNRCTNVSINDGARSYSIAQFSSITALKQIADTVEGDAACGINAKPES